MKEKCIYRNANTSNMGKHNKERRTEETQTMKASKTTEAPKTATSLNRAKH